MTGFTTADVTVASGTLSELASADGGVRWTARFTPDSGIESASNLLALGLGGLLDLAGNAGSGTASSPNLAIDTLAPQALSMDRTVLTQADTGVDAAIGRLSATETSTVRWTLATGNGVNDADNTLFNLSGATLRSNGVLSGGRYQLRVGATDAAGNLSTLALTVDVNSAPLLSTPAPVTLTDTAADDQPADSTGTLSATDADGIAAYGLSGASATSVTLGGKLYNLAKTGLYGTLYLDSGTGAYRHVADAVALNALPAGADASESFTVTATDAHALPLQSSATLQVRVAAADDTPTLATPAILLVTDTAALDSFAAASGTLSARDRDAGSILRYGLSGGTVSGDSISLAGAHGTLRLDRSTGDYTYTPDGAAVNALVGDASDRFTLSVSDGTATTTAEFNVTLAGSNDRPLLPAEVSATVAENLPAGTTITVVNATDADAGQTLRYSLAGADAALFQIDPVSGALSLRAAADFETRSRYQLQVVATDDAVAALSARQTLTVQVSDVNEAPTLLLALASDSQGARTLSLAEDTAVGTVLFTARASDVDAGQTLRFSLAGADAALLHIDAATGVVSLARALDFELQRSARFTVVVTDSGQSALSQRAEVTLQVTDVVETVPDVPASAAPAPAPARAETPATTPRATEAPAPQALSRLVGAADDTQAAGRVATGATGPTTATQGFAVPVVSVGESGTALVVVNQVPVQRAVPGEGGRSVVSFTIPAETFGHADAGATVTLQATQADGSPLPAWLSFDPKQGRFGGTPPDGFSGGLVIKLIASDNEGRQVDIEVRLDAAGPRPGAALPTGLPDAAPARLVNAIGAADVADIAAARASAERPATGQTPGPLAKPVAPSRSSLSAQLQQQRQAAWMGQRDQLLRQAGARRG